MKLSLFTDYSLRLLLFLARNRGCLVTVAEVAGFYSISAAHVKKVVRDLAKSGLIKTVRGKNGGFRLACDPAEINIADVIRRQENLDLIDCTACPASGCKLPRKIQDGVAAFLSVFEGTTVSDLM